ncbi:MAG TPA: NAD(+)--rifampin ADP-ribosyltransferase [Bacteroidia bacterium]|nr:NAD(+)--rifampin ADP-ribosyltransferase [Bacteroidia bacterium]
MSFSPFNPIVKRCLLGISLEEKAQPNEAAMVFSDAWKEATNSFEKFLTAYFVARHQKNVQDSLRWYEASLQYALQTEPLTLSGVFSTLYTDIARCNESLGQTELVNLHRQLAEGYRNNFSDPGPFYHGTKANLQIGDVLSAGNTSNYKQDLIMNHIYFTALPRGAGLAAALAKGEGKERVYCVVPSGPFEHDPNVTDKKFPGNLTRSYRTEFPLKIVGEISDWDKDSPEDLQTWREKLNQNKGDIIN